MDWPRGLRRLAIFMGIHWSQTGVRHWMATVTPPDVRDHEHPYTSPSRIFAFNQVIFDVARVFNMTVLDFHAPLDAREDGRADRVHFCHEPRGNWGGATLTALCA